MNRDELDSQLSAMFDGELPAAECELLSRRLVREEQLRATWSRYAVIGAALRAEPLARVRPDFAQRVSAALVPAAVAGAAAAPRTGRLLRNGALGAGLAAGVAGAAIMLLRNGLPVQEQALSTYTPSVARATVARALVSAPAAAPAVASGEPASYVVPPASTGGGFAVPASLANYVIAHSEVSSPLVRGSLLSALIGSESLQPAVAEPGLAVRRAARRPGNPDVGAAAGAAGGPQ